MEARLHVSAWVYIKIIHYVISMDRRSFLFGTSTLAITQLLMGCGSQNKNKFTVDLLKKSLPSLVIDQYQKLLGKQKVDLKISLQPQLQDIFQQLKAWGTAKKETKQQNWLRWVPGMGNSETQVPGDLVTLGDCYLQDAIALKLIRPLDVGKLSQWSSLPNQWQQLVTRDDSGFPSSQGKVWAAPYRWGSTMMIYRRDKFADLGLKIPQDWSDLWRDDLRNRISLLDHPRETIGLTLKKLGQSYNTRDLSTVPQLETELQALNRNVKFYDSSKYLEPLLLGDTLISTGWSHDILPVLTRYPQLAAIVPQSGTAIWADMWVNPINSQNQVDLLSQWIDFYWQPQVANKISVLTKTNSPIPTNITTEDIQPQLQKLLISNQTLLEKSEFILPLPVDIEKQYQDLFQKIKLQ
jgi:putative spermidine/putrescine transport system substrate-binding protein